MEPKSHSNTSSPTTLHRECLKNHAAAIGGHALDGCCEFMPSPAANHSNPSSLKCAACGCHRNFHRKISPSPASADEEEFDDKGDAFGPRTLLALSRDDRRSARKRFRTKFSAEQKGRMMQLSERLGWRLQKRDESLVEDCCREIGVGKGVFKVWMHNNKYQLFRGLRSGEEKSDVVGDVGGNGLSGEADLNVMNGSSSSS